MHEKWTFIPRSLKFLINIFYFNSKPTTTIKTKIGQQSNFLTLIYLLK